MKKLLLLATSALLLLAGCAKEESGLNGLAGDVQTVTFTASMDNSAVTKAVADNDGNAASVNRCIMEIYYDGSLFARDIQPVKHGTTITATFTTQVVANRTYKVAFWADHVKSTSALETDLYYTTNEVGGLQAIAIKEPTGYIGNDDARDAFFAVKDDCTVTQAGTSFNITLKRPFAQVNVITTDWDKANKVTGLKPTSVDVTIKNPLTAFNALTGVASTTVSNLTYNADIYTSPTSGSDATLSMDYLFASADKAVIDIDWKAGQGTDASTVSHSFTNIPYQRNYRTNIKGALLTTTGQWTVTVDPQWTEEIDQNIASVGSIAAANDSLKAGKTNIVIANPEDASTAIEFPEASNGKSISFKITGASGKTITFKNASDANGPSDLFITSDSQNLDINCPNTHVEILTGAYDAVTATTSATTLVVSKDVTIDKLAITGGNAEIHGIVNAITKASASTVTYRIETVAALKNLRDLINAATWVNGNIYLDADIDLNKEEWTPISGWHKDLNIDGQGYTIKNLQISEASGDYSGFISTSTGIIIKNLNIDGAEIAYSSSVGEDARVGILAGQLYGGSTVENCSVKNAKITACQKTGGLIGYLEGDCNTPYMIKNCSVENISIKSNDPNKILQHGAGGFLGFAKLDKCPLITISGCSAKNITIYNFRTEPYESSELQRVPHAFIGSVVNSYTGTEEVSKNSHSVVLENNTISGTNTVLPTCIYSSKYFGWGGNAEERPTWKGHIYIDGEKWVPDYSFECGDVKYYTLAQAVTAAKAGSDKTVTILKTGDYTLPGDVAGITIQAGTNVVPTFTITSKGNIASADESTLKGLKFILPGDGYTGFQHSDATFDGCSFENLLTTYCGDKKQIFKNCSFKSSGNNYGVWAYGPCEFNTCTFTTDDGKAIYLYAESLTAGYVVDFDGCTFTNTGNSCRKPAILVKTRATGLYTNGYKTTVTNCTANGFTDFSSKGDDVYDYAADGLWGIETKEGDDLTYTATYLTVDGTQVYPAYYPDADDAKLHHIISAKGLRAFRYEINDQKINYAGHTVQLDVDIDLENETWTPVECKQNEFGTFDGNDHKISNFTVNVDGSNGIKHAGLFGAIGCGTVKDLSIYNADVTGINHVGAIVGYGMCGKFENCKVYNSNVTSVVTGNNDGDKAGAICGYLTAENSASMTGCYAEGCTITAYRDLGSLVGYANGPAVVTGNTATGCTVICKTDKNYKTYTKRAEFDAGEIVGEAVAAATISNNTATNITITYSPDIAE